MKSPVLTKPAPMQLDLFAHSRDVSMKNAVIEALQRHLADSAMLALTNLAQHFPGDRDLAPLNRLCAVLQTSGRGDANSLAARVSEFINEISPIAQRLFGAEKAQAWLAPLWLELAEWASTFPYQRERLDSHEAVLRLYAGDWQGARQATEDIEAWWRIPDPLAWMAEIDYRMVGLAAAWPLLFELAWLAPARFQDLIERLGADSPRKLLRHFEQEVQDELASAILPNESALASTLTWFPAWALVEEPNLDDLFRQARQGTNTLPERTARVISQLLGLEKQGRHHDIIPLRARLRELSPALFRLYMARRS